MRLRPGMSVLLRDESTVQVGLARPLVLTEVSPAQRDFLASLEDSTAPISATMLRTFPQLIEALEQHGALVSRDDSEFARAMVRVHGLGAIGSAVAVTLARAGVGSLALVDPTPAGLEPPGTYGLGATPRSCAGAAAWMLRERVPQVRLAAEFETASVEVVIGHGAIPAHQAAELTCRDVPHLPVVADEHGVTVGPMVFPGVSACMRCTELALTNRDAAWPRLAMQCALSRRPRLDPLASEMAAAVAASEVVAALRHLAGQRLANRGPASQRPAGNHLASQSPAGNHLASQSPAGQHPSSQVPAGGWRVDGLTGALHRLPSVAPHPECGCGAAGPVGDEVAARRAAMRAI